MTNTRLPFDAFGVGKTGAPGLGFAAAGGCRPAGAAWGAVCVDSGTASFGADWDGAGFGAVGGGCSAGMGTAGSEAAAARSLSFFWRMPVKSSEDTIAAATKKAATEAIKTFSFNASFPRRFLLFRGRLFAFLARGFGFFPADFTFVYVIGAKLFIPQKKPSR
jgi:hypothetical protein